MWRRIVGIQIDRTEVLTFGARPVPIVIEFDVGQRGMRLCQRLIDFDCSAGSLLGQRENIMWRTKALAAQKAVAVRQAGIGERIVWIFFYGLTEIVNRLLKALFRSLIPIEAALQIKLVSLSVSGITAVGALPLGVGQACPQLLQNVPRDLALHGYQVPELAIVVLAPKMIAGARFHQFQA